MTTAPPPPAPTPALIQGDVFFWVDGEEVVVTDGVDGPVQGGRQLPDGGPRDRVYHLQDGYTAYVVEDDSGFTGLMDLEMVGTRGRRVAPPDGGHRPGYGDVVAGGGRTFSAVVLQPHVELLGIATTHDDQRWTWLQATGGQATADLPVDTVVVDLARGLWVLQREGEVAGEVALGGGVSRSLSSVGRDEQTDTLMAVVPAGQEAAVVADPALPVRLVEHHPIPGSDLQAVLVTVEHPSSAGTLLPVLSGLDTDGEGAVDIPYDDPDAAGGPTEVGDDDPSVVLAPSGDEVGSSPLSGIRWDWEEPGMVYVVPGLRLRDTEHVLLRTSGTHGQEGREAPWDQVTVGTGRGSTTYLTLPAGLATEGAQVVVVDDDGEERVLP